MIVVRYEQGTLFGRFLLFSSPGRGAAATTPLPRTTHATLLRTRLTLVPLLPAVEAATCGFPLFCTVAREMAFLAAVVTAALFLLAGGDSGLFFSTALGLCFALHTDTQL